MIMRGLVRTALAALASVALSGCAVLAGDSKRTFIGEPSYAERTWSEYRLHALPPPAQRVTVAVYSYTDQTGQFKPSENMQTLSRAVSQGAGSIMVEALRDAGQRSWFQVIERERVDNLLRERQIIREMRQRYLGEEQINPQALPPLLFAGIILEGGVIGYDTNTITGGAGARYLGIGLNTRYRQDTVTVYLRAVSVRTGEVLVSVNSKKTIASYALQANAFRYVAFRELLEAETGVTTNEPDQLALRQAIEQAVYQLVVEGADIGVWGFADLASAKPLLEQHRRALFDLRSSDPTPERVTRAINENGRAPMANQVSPNQRALVAPAAATPPQQPPAPPPPEAPLPPAQAGPPRESIMIDGRMWTQVLPGDPEIGERIILDGRTWRLMENGARAPSPPPLQPPPQAPLSRSSEEK